MSKKRKRQSAPEFPPILFPYIQQASDDTLRRISRFDYGMEAERHFNALRQIVHEQNGYVSLSLDQAFYPGDVIELAAFDPQDAFCYTVCHLIMIQSELAETCRFTLSPYWKRYRTGEREALPPTMQAQLDAAYRLADERSLIDHDW
ncbi:hypothetical protein H9Q10_02950 [Eikenella sp. S3360]|uniref:Uncharacterized protein n=1 Tax=Eikenella glucosivorans TaxID=2766967 RepID=A0ABS0N8P0_9NEIS|nr:hypothetical protein [Eikenella glucosivorans]MBH5328629.1 hypothetical protein [Eikenella glucosivorans]